MTPEPVTKTEVSLRGGQAWSGRLRRNQRLRLVDVEGRACLSALFYNAADPLERYNMADTLKAQFTAFLTAGRVLYSDMGRVLASIVADDCGWHDTISGLGDAAANAARFGAGSYQTLRNECPMNVRARNRRVPLTPQLQADIARVDEIWSGCRVGYGAGGGCLFGEFSIADAMFAPVFFRFQTYGAGLGAASQTYLEHALNDPAVREWQDAAMLEGHPLPFVDQVGA